MPEYEYYARASYVDVDGTLVNNFCRGPYNKETDAANEIRELQKDRFLYYAEIIRLVLVRKGEANA